MHEPLIHFLFGWTGMFNEAGWVYGLWSGFCGGFGILAGLTIAYRKLNCHTKGCWRIGHHDLKVKHSPTDPGTIYRVCRHCHPEINGHRFNRQEMHEMNKAHMEENT